MRAKIQSFEVDHYQVRYMSALWMEWDALPSSYSVGFISLLYVSQNIDTSLGFPVLVCIFLQVHDSYAWNIDVLLSTSTMAKAVEILEATPVGDILSKYLTLLHLKVHLISKLLPSYFAFFFSRVPGHKQGIAMICNSPDSHAFSLYPPGTHRTLPVTCRRDGVLCHNPAPGRGTHRACGNSGMYRGVWQVLFNQRPISPYDQ